MTGSRLNELSVAVEAALADLSPRLRSIVRSRYGFAGELQTLEEIGSAHGVTRERVRQLQKKALKSLRTMHGSQLETLLTNLSDEVWDVVSGGSPVIPRNQVDDRFLLAPPYVRLAFALAGLSVIDWLRQSAELSDSRWVRRDKRVENRRLERELSIELNRATLPVPLRLLDPSTPLISLIPSIEYLGFRVHNDYVFSGRLTTRTRRTIGLHRAISATGPVVLDRLLECYWSRNEDDLCSHRDAEIVMSSYPHLFFRIADGTWSPASGKAPVSIVGTPASSPFRAIPPFRLGVDFTVNVKAKSTIASILVEKLRREGPLRLAEILAWAKEGLPEGRSPHSVGPILLTYKHLFMRLLPGLYGLRSDVHYQGTAASIRRIPGVFTEEQLSTYVHARRSGSRLFDFPLWSPVMEALWVEWAARHASPALYESLLCVIEPLSWPKEHSFASGALAGRPRFRLRFEPPISGQRLPALDRLLAAAIFAKWSFGLGWVAANRVMSRRLTDGAGASVLALLTSLGVLSASNDWQSMHELGPSVDQFIEELRREQRAARSVDWESEMGLVLCERALSFQPPASSWTTREALTAIFEDGQGSSVSPPKDLKVLDRALADSEALQELADAQEALRLIAGASELESDDFDDT